MKNNPAFPNNYKKNIAGLTKREYFAAKALQGMLSNSFAGSDSSICLSETHRNDIAEFAVAQADALIEALEKEENDPVK